MSTLTQINEAFAKRADFVRGLAKERTNCYRLFCGKAEGIDGISIDIFGQAAIVNLYEKKQALDSASLIPAYEKVAELTGVKSVYLKNFVIDRTKQLADEGMYQATPVWGVAAPVEYPVLENGLQFLIRPYSGFSAGLFLDQRANRQMMRELSSGGRVLNLFSYTCGFSVYAAAGNAAGVTSVDASKKYLDWGKRNFEANSLSQGAHRFICEDALEYLKRAKKKGETYDLVIVDPPSFGRSGKKTFSLERDLRELVKAVIGVTQKSGRVFLSVNHQAVTEGHLRTVFSECSVGRAKEFEKHARPPLDFQWTDGQLAVAMVSLG